MTETQIKIDREEACTMYETQSLALRVSKITDRVGLIYRVAPATFGTVTISRKEAARALRDMRKARK